VAKAIITLHDTGDGQFQAHIEYESETGFAENSMAHQYGHLLMLQLGRWADPTGPAQLFGNAPTLQHEATQEPDKQG
jgi:hypothetical protein